MIYMKVSKNNDQKAGPFTLILTWLGLIISLLYLIPLVTFWLAYSSFYDSILYLIDNYVLRRNK